MIFRKPPHLVAFNTLLQHGIIITRMHSNQLVHAIITLVTAYLISNVENKLNFEFQIMICMTYKLHDHQRQLLKKYTDLNIIIGSFL